MYVRLSGREGGQREGAREMGSLSTGRAERKAERTHAEANECACVCERAGASAAFCGCARCVRKNRVGVLDVAS